MLIQKAAWAVLVAVFVLRIVPGSECFAATPSAAEAHKSGVPVQITVAKIDAEPARGYFRASTAAIYDNQSAGNRRQGSGVAGAYWWGILCGLVACFLICAPTLKAGKKNQDKEGQYERRADDGGPVDFGQPM